MQRSSFYTVEDGVYLARGIEAHVFNHGSGDVPLLLRSQFAGNNQLGVARKKRAQQCREISGAVVEHVRFSAERKVDPVFGGIEPTALHIRL